MGKILAEIRDGSFAREWLAENRAGRVNFERLRQEDRDHEIERVGKVLRAMMPWLAAAGQGDSGVAGQQSDVTSTDEAAERLPRRTAAPLPR
jgi:hypothetical protein